MQDTTIDPQSFKPSDRLKVEIVPYNDSYVIPNRANPAVPLVLGKGNETYERELDGASLLQVLADVEPEPEAWERAVKAYKRDEARFKKRLENDPGVSRKTEAELEGYLTKELMAWSYVNSPSRSFFESEGRGRLPIKSIKILENLGPAAGDFQAKYQDDRELNELLKAKLRREILSELEPEQASAKPKK